MQDSSLAFMSLEKGCSRVAIHVLGGRESYPPSGKPRYQTTRQELKA